jgi:ubiquitin carboxyl-terminal hydrolase 9/24
MSFHFSRLIPIVPFENILMTAKDHSIQSSLLDVNDHQSTDSSDPNEQQQQQQQQSPPPDYISSTIQEIDPSDDEDDEQSQTDENSIYDENGQIKFPLNDLIKLEEQLNQTRWVVPVLPDGELIKCLRAAVRLAAQSNSLEIIFFKSIVSFILELDTKSDLCQRFIRDSLVNSFTKVLCDEAVQTWKHEIFVRIFSQTKTIKCFRHLEIYLSKLYDFY